MSRWMIAGEITQYSRLARRLKTRTNFSASGHRYANTVLRRPAKSGFPRPQRHCFGTDWRSGKLGYILGRAIVVRLFVDAGNRYLSSVAKQSARRSVKC